MWARARLPGVAAAMGERCCIKHARCSVRWRDKSGVGPVANAGRGAVKRCNNKQFWPGQRAKHNRAIHGKLPVDAKRRRYRSLDGAYSAKIIGAKSYMAEHVVQSAQAASSI